MYRAAERNRGQSDGANSLKSDKGNRLAKGTEQLKLQHIELWENLLSFTPCVFSVCGVMAGALLLYQSSIFAE